MNGKLKAALWILALVVIVGGAFIAYSFFGGKAGTAGNLAAPSTGPAVTASTTPPPTLITPAPAVTQPETAPAPSPSVAMDETMVDDSSDAQEEVEDAGPLAPDFTVLDEDGAEVKLSDFLGTPVVLNFWASWCPPCKSEMPEFDKVFQELRDDVAFIMVDLADGQRETVESGKQHVSAQGYSFPVYFDVYGEAAYNYGISSIPTTVFIDKDGYVVTGAIGAINEQTLRTGIGYITG